MSARAIASCCSLAAGELAGGRGVELAQDRKQVEDLLEVAAEIRVAPTDGAPDAQVLLDGQSPEDLAALGHECDPTAHDRVRPEPVDALALERDGAVRRLKQPGDRLEGGAFAGAIGTDQADGLALADLETKARERR